MARLAAMLSSMALALATGAPPATAKDARLQGNPKNGEAVYERCLACHALAYDRTGPRHCGLFGRHAGSVKDFEYSEAMKRSNIVWNEETLDRFLANPLTAVPGTTMGYAGVVDRKERADLIAYLQDANESAQCANQPFPIRHGGIRTISRSFKDLAWLPPDASNRWRESNAHTRPRRAFRRQPKSLP